MVPASLWFQELLLRFHKPGFEVSMFWLFIDHWSVAYTLGRYILELEVHFPHLFGLVLLCVHLNP
jgi:hypothetical protein